MLVTTKRWSIFSLSDKFSSWKSNIRQLWVLKVNDSIFGAKSVKLLSTNSTDRKEILSNLLEYVF